LSRGVRMPEHILASANEPLTEDPSLAGSLQLRS
jgi:hypothetical protein